jgi:hypothetical protein
LGGGDVENNLWPQQWEGVCGAHAKDKIEASTWRAVCKDHTMTLEDAQKLFLGNYWEKLQGCKP